MTLRISSGARKALVNAQGFAAMFNRGSGGIYTGTQPASADDPTTGTLLGLITISSGALTKETQATGTIVITGGSTSVATVTVGTFNIIPDGAVPYNTSTAQTATDLAEAINRNGIFSATVSGSTVTIKPRPGAGTAYNGLTLTSTGSVTATYGGGTVSGGVAAVNGLILVPSATAGVISKSGVWSMNGIAVGTAGCFRLFGSVNDDNSTSTTLVRMDGSVAVSGGDMALSNLSVTVSSPHTVDTFNITMPAQ